MALITCPDCGREISDAAPACVGCGRPKLRPPPLPASKAVAEAKAAAEAKAHAQRAAPHPWSSEGSAQSAPARPAATRPAVVLSPAPEPSSSSSGGIKALAIFLIVGAAAAAGWWYFGRDTHLRFSADVECKGTPDNRAACSIHGEGEGQGKACFDVIVECGTKHVAHGCSGVMNGGATETVVLDFVPPVDATEKCSASRLDNVKIE